MQDDILQYNYTFDYIHILHIYVYVYQKIHMYTHTLLYKTATLYLSLQRPISAQSTISRKQWQTI